MHVDLDGATIVITGSTQGVGAAVALEAARSGAKAIVICGRNSERGEAVAAEIETIGTQALFVQIDLEDTNAPRDLIAACLTRFGRIDALVNAAGVTDRAALADATPEIWDKLNRINVRAPFFLMQSAVAEMVKQGAGGVIVNILSMNVYGGTPELAVYSSTKAALAVLTKNAAHAHRFDRIRINGVNMGWADTPAERTMQADTLGNGEGWLDEAATAQPFGRLLSAEDVARLTIFLLSSASMPMTGALIDQEQWVLGPRD